jgi:hypothetical protein
MFFCRQVLVGDVILMREDVFPRICCHRLAPKCDASGVSCDEDGPAIGPIRLLIKSVSGFAPRPVQELNDVFAHVVERPVDCSDLVRRLHGVAAALNEGQITRAIFKTLFMDLPALTVEQASRAAGAAKLFKASANDPQHPGWPKGTEGGLGGRFRPTNGATEVASVIQGNFPANDNFCTLTAAIPLTIDGLLHTNCYYNCANKQSFVTTWYGSKICPTLDMP